MLASREIARNVYTGFVMKTAERHEKEKEPADEEEKDEQDWS